MTAPSVAPPLPGGKRRRPVWLPALAALFFALLTAWLGQWQLGRAEEKRARQAAFDAAAVLPAVDLAAFAGDWSELRYRRVRVTGRYQASHQVFLDNRIHRGRAGYQAVLPLDYAGGAVLVNRGWLPAAADRAVLPRAAPPAGMLTVEGVLVPARSRYVELSDAGVQDRVWQNLDLERFRAGYPGDLPDALILQTSAAGDGLARDWPRPDAGVDRHLGYAVQWFALTAAIAALYAYYGLGRRFRAAH